MCESVNLPKLTVPEATALILFKRLIWLVIKTPCNMNWVIIKLHFYFITILLTVSSKYPQDLYLLRFCFRIVRQLLPRYFWVSYGRDWENAPTFPGAAAGHAVSSSVPLFSPEISEDGTVTELGQVFSQVPFRKFSGTLAEGGRGGFRGKPILGRRMVANS